MKRYITDGKLAIIIVVAILVIDQIIKILVKTNMALDDSIHIADWFYIRFIENNGMAYGMTFFNKLALSLFRLVAISVISYYVYKLVKRPQPKGYIICLSMILAGAMGNIIDSMFYGLIFSPFGSGYASFLHGKVVDMFYFPIIETTWPQWVPQFGGKEFIFFSPIFNFADACISVGVVLLLLFYRKELELIGTTMKGETKNEESHE